MNTKNRKINIQQNFSRSVNPVRSFNKNHDSVRISSLGGFGDVTQNMFVYEFIPNGDFKKSQIIIVDCGVGFPEEDDFGVDLQIPDTHYLQDKKDRILGIFITHGHEDHIGAVRFILPLLGDKIPIFAPRLATAFIKARLAETKIRANIQTYDDATPPISKGVFTIDPVRVTHSIPDTYHFAITTPIGIFYHGSDFKFDVLPLFGQPSDLNHIGKIGDKKVLCLLSDCLGAESPGFSPSERSLAEKFRQKITPAKGRVFVTSISSNIVRWGQAIEYAKSVGRKIAIVGMSIDRAINIAKELGYLNLNNSDIVPIERIKNFPDNKIMLLVAGFAGQPNSALSKMIMGKHRVKMKPGDKVIFSAPDYIPGTGSKINTMIDNLSKMGVEVSYGSEKIHVSGHGYQKEHAILINLLKPKYLLPIGGNFRHVKAYQGLAKNLGYQDDQFINPDVDAAVTFNGNGTYDTKFRLSLRKVLIDGFGVGDVGTTVLRDRKLLAEDGMFSVVLLVNAATGQLTKDPIILSRGFVFVKQHGQLINYLQKEIVNRFNQVTSKPANFEFIREEIQAHIETIIKKRTDRQPMVLPLIIEV